MMKRETGRKQSPAREVAQEAPKREPPELPMPDREPPDPPAPKKEPPAPPVPKRELTHRMSAQTRPSGGQGVHTHVQVIRGRVRGKPAPFSHFLDGTVRHRCLGVVHGGALPSDYPRARRAPR